MDIDAMTREGKGRDGKGEGKDQMLSRWKGKNGKCVKEKDTGHGKGSDTGEEKGVRCKGCCCKQGMMVHSVEADTADPQDVNHTAEHIQPAASGAMRSSGPVRR